MKNSLRLALALLLAAGVAAATTVVPLTIEQLTAVSSHVVEGRALQSWSQWNAAHSIIYTYTKFAVTRSLKGQTAGTVIVRQLGGALDGTTQRVAGVHYWVRGEQAVLFLRPGDVPDGSLVVTGTMQGNFRMRRAGGVTTVSNGAPQVSAYKMSAGTTSEYQGNTMRLQELETRVQKAVQP